ncbi:2,4-dichlorophenol 6-monooxygenase, partial [Streptomyces sp. NPDC059744]
VHLVGMGAFTVVTGLSGGVWGAAAAECGDTLGIPLTCVRIGSENSRDAYGEWRRASGTAEDGCLLVRPDGHIAWRSSRAPQADSSAGTELLGALRAVLQC